MRKPIRYAPPIAKGDHAIAAPYAESPKSVMAVPEGTMPKPSSSLSTTYAIMTTHVTSKM